MPKVDFYVLSAKHSVEQFVCQLTQKIWQQGHAIHIHADDQQQASQFDQRLWTFSDISFLPHQLCSETEPVSAPISIGWQQPCAQGHDVLLNLNRSIPAFSQQFARIVEIVAQDSDSKQIGREHFRQYRRWSYEIDSHQL